jgi:hypothetical protein
MKKTNNYLTVFMLGSYLLVSTLASCSSNAGEKDPKPRAQVSNIKVPVEDPNYGTPGTCYFCGSNPTTGYLAGSSLDTGFPASYITPYPGSSYNAENKVYVSYQTDRRTQKQLAVVTGVLSRYTIPGSGSDQFHDNSPTNGDVFVQESWSSDADISQSEQGGWLVHIAYHLESSGVRTATRYMTIDDKGGLGRTVTF